MLLAGLMAGVLVSIFQTVTSIQDNVLAFIPRAAAIFIVFALTFPWMLRAADRLRAAADPAAAGAGAMIELTPLAGFGALLVRPGMLVLAAPVFGGRYAPAPVRDRPDACMLALVLAPVVPLPRRSSRRALAVIVAARGG